MYNLVEFSYITNPQNHRFQTWNDSGFRSVAQSKISEIERADIRSEVKSDFIALINKRLSCEIYYGDPDLWYNFEVAKILKRHYPDHTTHCDLSYEGLSKSQKSSWTFIQEMQNGLKKAAESGDVIAYRQCKTALRKPFTGTVCLEKNSYERAIEKFYTEKIYVEEPSEFEVYKRNTAHHKAGEPKMVKTKVGAYVDRPIKDVFRSLKKYEQCSIGTHSTRCAFYIDVDQEFTPHQQDIINETCDRLGIARPMISLHKSSRHYDVFWFLDSPFNWRTTYLNDAIHGLYLDAFTSLKAVFNSIADPRCTGYNCKNPYGPACEIIQEAGYASTEALTAVWFEKHRKTYTAKSVKPRDVSHIPVANLEEDGDSRHMYLFDRARFLGFQAIYYNGCIDPEKLASTLRELSESDEIKIATGKDEVLPEQEIDNIVSSVTEFCIKNFKREIYENALKKNAQKYNDADRKNSEVFRSVKAFIKMYKAVKIKLDEPKITCREVADRLEVSHTAAAMYLKHFCKKLDRAAEAYLKNYTSKQLEAAVLFLNKYETLKKRDEQGYLHFSKLDAYTPYANELTAIFRDISESEVLSEIFGICNNAAMKDLDYLRGLENRIPYLESNRKESCTLYSAFNARAGLFDWVMSTKSYGTQKKSEISRVFTAQRTSIYNYYQQAQAA